MKVDNSLIPPRRHVAELHEQRCVACLVLAVSVLGASCAGPQTQAPPPRPAKDGASSADAPDGAQPPQTPSDTDEDREYDVSAGALLQRAFQYFRDDRNQAAAETFRQAINTGNLNDAGHAVAYWHIFLCEQSVGQVGPSHEALSSFVVVAEDLIDERASQPFGPNAGDDFIERFDLLRRLTRARAILSATWADRTEHFGRSREHPVLVHSREEMRYFLELVGPCRDPDEHQAILRAHKASLSGQDKRPETILVSCDSPQGQSKYYFELVSGR